MNQRPNDFPISVRALTELQLSDWQYVASQQEDADPSEIAYAHRQIEHLNRELGISPTAGAQPDTHVRTSTHGDEPAFVVVGEFDGLSKREYMATHLMGAMVAAKGAWYNPKEPAQWAAEHADALIEALNKPTK